MPGVAANLDRRLALARGGEGLVHGDLDRRPRRAVEAQQREQLAVRVGDGDDRRLAFGSQLVPNGGIAACASESLSVVSLRMTTLIPRPAGIG